MCLLARIETSTSTPYGMTSVETPVLWSNVANNNNIAWKNVSVVDINPSPSQSGFTIVRNVNEDSVLTTLYFKIPEREYANSFLNFGSVKVNLGADLFAKWEDGGSIGEGFEICDDTLFKITDSIAWVGNIKLDTSEMHVVETIYNLYVQQLNNCSFNYDIEQYDSIYTDTTLFTGGVRFHFNTCSEEEEGRKANPSFGNSSKNDSHGKIKLYPNPNDGSMQLDYTLSKDERGELVIFDLTGRKINSYTLNEGKNTLRIKEERLNTGIYFYQVFLNERRLATDKLIIIK